MRRSVPLAFVQHVVPACVILSLSLFPAPSQSSPSSANPTVLELKAEEGPPIMLAEVNGKVVRLEVEPDLQASVALNVQAAKALGVRPALTRSLNISLRGGEQIRGRLSSATFKSADGLKIAGPVGLFSAPVSTLADGVVSLSALPHDVIRFSLRPPVPGETIIELNLSSRRGPFASVDVGGQRFGLAYRLSGPQTMINRPGTALLAASNDLVPNGALQTVSVLLGLTTLAQPVSAKIKPLGLPLANVVAETNAPIEGASDPSVIVVVATKPGSRPPRLTLGRETLRACSSITLDRRAGLLRLSCLV